MTEFLSAIPGIVLYGCGVLIAFAALAAGALLRDTEKARTQMGLLTSALKPFLGRDGLTLHALDELRTACGTLDVFPRELWSRIDRHIERYTSPADVEGWFLTEPARELLPHEVVVGRQFNASLYNAIPGLLTAAGLTLTFLAILLALYGVHYDKANTAEPITGIDKLINGLSGKFLSSILALCLSICFTFYEKFRARRLRQSYERLLMALSEAVPYLSQSRILLDIQRFAADQTISISHISSDVVDRLVGAFNTQVVPALSDGMSSGVAEKMQSEFRPIMQRMNETLEELKVAIVGLESQKQESVAGEIRGLLTSLEQSIVGALSKMGSDFHGALTGAASQEFGNVQGTLEATRQMLSDMNVQFGLMQAAFSAIVEKAEQSTADNMKTGREQTEALTALMNGLMSKMQESADQNLGAIRSQLTLVVGDLAEKVGSLSKDMMAAANVVAAEAQASASQVLDQTGEWSEATAKRLESLLDNIEARSKDFESAGASLLAARDYLRGLINANATALERMADASRQVQAYSTGLAGQSKALEGISELQARVTAQMREVSGNLRTSSEQNEKLLAEYRRAFDGYRGVIDGLDQSIAKVFSVIQSGLRDYNQSVEKNLSEVVKIANPLISEASNLLQTQIAELGEQLEELGSVISTAVDRANGRTR
jgi:hypothetical protein